MSKMKLMILKQYILSIPMLLISGLVSAESIENKEAKPLSAERAPQTTETLTRELVSLRVIPSSPVLTGAEAVQRIVVLGQGADGLERDVTNHSNFKLSDAAIAGIDDAGRLVALKDGETKLEVSLSGKQTLVPVSVQGSQQQRPFSFARN